MIYQIYSAGDTSLLHIKNIGFSDEPRQTSFGPGTRNSFFIYYIIDGKGYYNGKAVMKGQGFLVERGQTEKYSPDKNEPWELLWIESDDDSIKGLMDTYNANERTQIFDYNYCDAFETVTEFIRLNHNRILSDAVVLEQFLHIYNGHAGHAFPLNSAEAYLDFAVKYIHSNIHRKISLKELAQATNISNEYLRRLFIEKFGLSPKQYINNHRLTIAKTMLNETDASVTQIAHATGFNTGIEFSKFFSANQRVSPTRYRQKKIPDYLL